MIPTTSRSKGPHRRRLARRFASAEGFGLVELMVSMALSTVIVLAAVALVEFVHVDVTRTDAQVSTDQRARSVLENIMLELHSGCLLPREHPVRKESSATVLRFISGSGAGPVPTSVVLHEVLYTTLTVHHHSERVLAEYTYPGSISNGKVLINESSTARRPSGNPRILAENILESTEKSESGSLVTLPVFSYYRYYEEGNAGYEAGVIDPTPLATPLTETEAEKVSKVTIAFSVAPEGDLQGIAKTLEPLALKDSAVYRIVPASTVGSAAPAPCE
jgi:hypothetical protein